jgi:hypothetical protein
MSQLISLTTDKDGIFQNYFEDTIKIPANSEIAFIKAMGINMDYIEYNFLTVPLVEDADRNKNILRVCVDGVNVSITWKLLFQMADALSQEAGGDGITEELFFSGAYRWSLEPEEPENIISSICAALEDKFLFYRFSTNCSYTRETLDGKAKPTHFGITSRYSVTKRLAPGVNNIEDYLENIGNHNVYKGTATTFAGQVTTTESHTVTYSTTDLAINGGMLTFNINSDTEMKVGVSFVNSTINNVTGATEDQALDFGIHYKSDGSGTYNIIRFGNELKQCNGMDGGAGGERLQDTFTIVFSRSMKPDSQIGSGYICYLLQGYDPANGDGDYEDYIIARQEMDGGYSPSFLLEGIDNNCIVTNIQCIEADEQDKESRTFFDMGENPKVFGRGTAYRNAHFFYLKNSPAMPEQTREFTREFFNKLGFVSWASNEPWEYDDYPATNTQGNGNPLNPLIISSRLEAPIQANKLISNDIIQFVQDFDDGVSPYPYLQLHVDDLNIISYEGNEPRGRQQNTATKVLANLAQQEDQTFEGVDTGDVSVYKNYDYEAYNPIYITLHNTEPLAFNQIRARLVGPDNQIVKLANTGQRSIIMLHVRKEQQ